MAETRDEVKPEAAKPEPEYAGHIMHRQLDDAIQELVDRIDYLEMRLFHVLGPRTAVAAHAPDDSVKYGSPLASALADRAATVRTQVDRIRAIALDLEI